MSDIDALAEGLLAALNETGYSLQHEYADSGVYDVAPALAAAPPVAALLARAALADELAEALERALGILTVMRDHCGRDHGTLKDNKGCPYAAYGVLSDPLARAALAKWEASHVE